MRTSPAPDRPTGRHLLRAHQAQHRAGGGRGPRAMVLIEALVFMSVIMPATA